MPARALVETYFDSVSYHITGDHPTREILPQDRELHRRIFQVGFQRGFEPLLVNVYSDTANAQDAEEAAVEFLRKVPGVLTPEEEETGSATFVKRLVEAKVLCEFAAGSLPPSRDDLDEFTRSYIAAMLSTTTDESDESGGDPLDSNYDVENIAPATLKRIVADCKKFQEENADAIAVGCSRGGGQWSDSELAGSDFYLTRVGAGAGFWDGDWPEDEGKRMTDTAHADGGVDLYIGDDGQIHAS